MIQSVQEQTAICTATGEICSVFAQTGSSVLTINVDQPTLAITSFDGSYNNGVFIYDLDVNNSSAIDGDGLNVDFYLDLDGDGMLSPGDSLISADSYAGLIGGRNYNDDQWFFFSRHGISLWINCCNRREQ